MGIERLIELEENQCTVSRIIAGEVFMLEKTVLFNPTVTNAGTAERSRKLRSAANVPARQASSIGESLPRLLAPSTTYLIRCVAAVDNVDFGAYLRLGQK